MNEINYPEIDVDQLMIKIREAVAKRGINVSATPPAIASLPAAASPPTAPVFEPLTDSLSLPVKLNLPFLSLSPEVPVSTDDSYHINDLLQYHDRDFVQNAYQAILKRAPDSKGYLHNIEMLRTGRFNKIDVLASLRFSEQGRKLGVKIKGLRLPRIIRRLGRIPVLGYLIQLIIGLLRLPVMIRNQRQSEAYLVSQLQAIADHVNESSSQIAKSIRQHRLILGKMLELPGQMSQQRDQLERQRQRLETTESIITSSILGRVEEGQEQFRQTEAETLLLKKRVKQLSQIVQQTRMELGEQDSLLRAWQLESENSGQVLSQHSVLRSAEDRQQWDALYALFEDQFRGDVNEIRERLKFYLPAVRETEKTTDILDLGCGNGDWLELLREEGLQARGVEVNSVMANTCRKRQLDVVEGDIFAYLRALPDRCLNIVTAFHLVEHMPFEAMLQLLAEIRRTLRPGGRVMIETPSPENLVVAACNFYSDPTHHKPVYPHTLRFILQNIGFTDVRLQFLHPVEGSPFDGDESLQPLHMWFYGPRDYSLIAQKV